MATKIIFYVYSCSAETEMDIRSLYVSGESQFLGGLPGTSKEAHRRILECQKKTKCLKCDAEVHKCEVERTKPITFPKNPNNSNSF
jgi:hypothetical protein